MVLSKVVAPEVRDPELFDAETEAEIVEVLIRLIENIEEEDGFLHRTDQKYLDKLIERRCELFGECVNQMMVRF